MRPDTEGPTETLLDRARRGDARAFEQLALEIERPLYRHAARMLGHDDAEDAVQDALLSAWKSLGSFEGTSFRAWVFRIVTNRALDKLRSRRRRPELPLDPPEDDDALGWAEPAAPGPELADLAADREALRVVEEALATVPAEQRAVLQAAKDGTTDQLGQEYNKAAKLLDKAAAKRVIHPNLAARKKSQLARLLKAPPAAASKTS